MDWLSNCIPTALIIPFLVSAFVAHELAEWSYERGTGLEGSSALFGLFVDLTAMIGQFGNYMLLIAYGYDYGWQKAVGLFVVKLLVGLFDQNIPIRIKRLGFAPFWLFRFLCLGAFFPILIYVCRQLSWFGLWPP
jgi:hypothetical protein